MPNSDMPWCLMAYLHAINMQLKRFPKLAECDTAKQWNRGNGWGLGINSAEAGILPGTVNPIRTKRTKIHSLGSQKSTKFNSYFEYRECKIKSTFRIESTDSEGILESQTSISSHHLSKETPSFCFLSCYFKKCQWLCTEIYFTNCFSLIYCIIYTFKELVRCNNPLQNLCNFFPTVKLCVSEIFL